MKYFLMKSEVDVFSIDDLAKVPSEPWDGVRNHTAKNIQKSMRPGDLAFFWGSNTKHPGIMGVIEVVRSAYPDATQFDAKSKYYDKTSDPSNPRWFNVDVKLRKKLENPVLLKDLKTRKELEDMPLFKMARLSVQTVPEDAWQYICREMNNEELSEFVVE